MKRLWDIAVETYAVHIKALAIIVVPILPSGSDIAAAVGIGLDGVATVLVAQRLPHMFADIDIPKWYTILVDGYLAIITTYFISGFPSYFEFTFQTYPKAVIPIIFLSTVVLWLDDDFEFEDE